MCVVMMSRQRKSRNPKLGTLVSQKMETIYGVTACNVCEPHKRSASQSTRGSRKLYHVCLTLCRGGQRSTMSKAPLAGVPHVGAPDGRPAWGNGSRATADEKKAEKVGGDAALDALMFPTSAMSYMLHTRFPVRARTSSCPNRAVFLSLGETGCVYPS